jgi:hypothetical protein
MALGAAIFSLLGAFVALGWPLENFKQGPFFGLIAILALSWTIVGKDMCKRYIFLI